MIHQSASETQMAFMPSEDIRGLLINFLHPDAADHITETRKSLGFRSVEACRNDDPSSTFMLRRFTQEAKGVILPFPPVVKLEKFPHPGFDGVPQEGIELTIEADLNGEDNMTQNARILGFSNEQNLVEAKLQLPGHYLAPKSEVQEQLDALRATIASRFSQHVLTITFHERSLTN